MCNAVWAWSETASRSSAWTNRSQPNCLASSLESPVKKPRSPFHRPSLQPAVVAEAAEVVVADDADEADTKIDAEESDSVLELEEDDGEVIVDPSVTESEKG